MLAASKRRPLSEVKLRKPMSTFRKAFLDATDGYEEAAAERRQPKPASPLPAPITPLRWRWARPAAMTGWGWRAAWQLLVDGSERQAFDDGGFWRRVTG